jgi:prepilin-type N-terminal cleavage/methylation domain-containing protein
VPTLKRVTREEGSGKREAGSRKRRIGFTLIELMVVLLILSVVGTAIGITLLRQQRFYRGASELLYARQGVRDAMEVLSTDIRGLSAADTIRLLADSAIELFANIGSSVVCQTSDEALVGLPSATSSGGNTLSAFLVQPDTGDLALFYRDSSENGSQWERHRIQGFSSRSLATTCPASTGFTRGEDAESGSGFLVALEAPLSTHVVAGAPVRFIRRGRYSLYQGADGESYLGYRRCNALGASVCGAIQPLSGPYRRYSGDTHATGLLFEYFDDAGGRLDASSSPLAVARVDVTARVESRHRVMVEGRLSRPGDSATVSVAVRNRAR